MGVQAGQREWLETLVDVCERILARDGDVSDPGYAAVRADVVEFLARTRRELNDLAAEDST